MSDNVKDASTLSRTPDLRVTPMPGAEELAAIVAAVQVHAAMTQSANAMTVHDSNRSAPTSRWAMAGRRESMQGLDADTI